jgi:hypothetical protein
MILYPFDTLRFYSEPMTTKLHIHLESGLKNGTHLTYQINIVESEGCRRLWDMING